VLVRELGFTGQRRIMANHLIRLRTAAINQRIRQRESAAPQFGVTRPQIGAIDDLLTVIKVILYRFARELYNPLLHHGQTINVLLRRIASMRRTVSSLRAHHSCVGLNIDRHCCHMC
jgi:hypothetical protein